MCYYATVSPQCQPPSAEAIAARRQFAQHTSWYAHAVQFMCSGRLARASGGAAACSVAVLRWLLTVTRQPQQPLLQPSPPTGYSPSTHIGVLVRCGTSAAAAWKLHLAQLLCAVWRCCAVCVCVCVCVFVCV